MPWQSLLHCWVSKAGRLTFSLQNQATFKFRCLLVFVAYCDTGRGKGLALWPSLFTRHSVVVNLWNVCRDGFQREINFLIFFFVGCMRQRVFQPDLQETSRSSHCSEACLGPRCKMPDAGCGFSTRTVWHFLAMFPFFCLACCLIGIAPWHSGFAHWLWKCLRLCPDVLHSQELWAQILDPESCQQLATDTHFSCLIWPTCTWNATSCSWLCISTIVQLTELFCRYSSSRLWQRSPSLAAVSFHILPFLGRPDMFDACFFDPFDCFDWHLDAFGCFGFFIRQSCQACAWSLPPCQLSDVSCQMWTSKELSKDWDCISCGLSFLWSSNLCLTLSRKWLSCLLAPLLQVQIVCHA